jgi:hypothetical protein
MMTLVFKRMKHSNITYNANTRVSLIDNSLIKALEIAKNRKLKLAKIKEAEKEKEKEKEKVIEMSESHNVTPYVKKLSSSYSLILSNNNIVV